MYQVTYDVIVRGRTHTLGNICRCRRRRRHQHRCRYLRPSETSPMPGHNDVEIRSFKPEKSEKKQAYDPETDANKHRRKRALDQKRHIYVLR